jgi:hypothetical protein
MTSQNSKTFSKSFFAENLHKFLLIYMEVLSKFPCEYRLKTKIDYMDCYCGYYDRWVRLRYCMICPKRKWS